MTYPGPNAHVYYNEAGEPLGWDYPSEYDPNDYYDDDPYTPDYEGEDESDDED
jgi:hypothetical protein